MGAMTLYKLRHFATFLFQLMNENDSHARDAILRASHSPAGTQLFMPINEQLRHYQGLRLIIQCFDRFFYVAKNDFSIGMYINQKEEEDK